MIFVLFWFLVVIVFFFLWLKFWFWHSARQRDILLFIINLGERCYWQEITAGPLQDFAYFLEKKYLQRSLKLLVFKPRKEWPENFLTDLVFPLPFSIFSLNDPWARAGFLIFIPSFWLKDLDQDCLTWFISHEVGHFHFRFRAAVREFFYFVFRPSAYHQGRHLKAQEYEADRFAAKIFGSERSITELKKARWLGRKSSDPNKIYQAISARIQKLQKVDLNSRP